MRAEEHFLSPAGNMPHPRGRTCSAPGSWAPSRRASLKVAEVSSSISEEYQFVSYKVW